MHVFSYSNHRDPKFQMLVQVQTPLKRCRLRLWTQYRIRKDAISFALDVISGVTRGLIPGKT